MIGSLSINGTTAVQGASSNQHRGHKPPAMDKTAEALGLSTDDLKSQLKSGKTLNDIASAQGVSSDDLLKAIKSDITANKPADAPDLSDDQLNAMATNIAAGKGPKGAHGHGHGPGGPGGPGGPPPVSSTDSDTDDNLSSLAGDLGISSDELLQKLQSGANTSSLLGSSAANPYASNKLSVSGGVAVDTYV